MSDFFNITLDEALPKVNPQSIEVLEEPKKLIDPSLAARLEHKPPSPTKNARNEDHIRKVHYSADFVTDGMSVTSQDWEILTGHIGQTLDEVFPMKLPTVIEVLEEPKGVIQPSLASRLNHRLVKC
mmetsp:Transcript_23219/g.39326  ORF Transcript_23219/g.39326 Transcript_23219/m.39326 type:complete len:126 (-) Transcript_23219:235-612(-)|eukprot:CAMPEP_0114421990 /NCGR_PEP_ID=MMETSP0103-20121206/5371_1 /TAXON_ID=37642 ORGANISM="Paraphysomonas imperforata, Strain PA2" /NCGR_SAMPLE_ID=MMETSP0103 /ASSEMBLY_ACC=CAM_ASM_000201 /LENGTH=125 /DNA_ID=CAMNT_0001590545 /DNA_START=124 /DNA_END=501 /DNA_ORIENTATION=+